MACASPDCKSGPYVVNNVGSTPTSPTIRTIGPCAHRAAADVKQTRGAYGAS